MLVGTALLSRVTLSLPDAAPTGWASSSPARSRTPVSTKWSMAAGVYPSSAMTSAVCSPTPGRGLSSGPGKGPASTREVRRFGRTTVRQRWAAATSGWPRTSVGALSRPQGTSAASSRRSRFSGAHLTQRGRQHVVQLVPVGHPEGVRAEPFVVHQFGPTENPGDEPAPLIVVLDGDVQQVPVAGDEGSIGGDRLVAEPGPGRVGPPVGRGQEQGAHPLGDGGAERHVQMGADAGSRPLVQGTEHPDEGVGAGRQIGQGDARLGGVVLGPRRHRHPQFSLHDQVERLSVPVVAVRLVAGDLADHGRLGELIQREDAAAEHTRGEVGHDDVGPQDQAPGDLLAA